MQRIATTTREGRHPTIKLERFNEALKDPSSGLTVPALTGVRKQSVNDCERLFGPKALNWMRTKGYREEAAYIEVVLNWHRASDERGLSELQRSRYNHAMLNYMLDRLMPCHRSTYDFSLLEINR